MIEPVLYNRAALPKSGVRDVLAQTGAFKIFFVSDIHGSDTCFRKLLAFANARRPNVVVIGGDMTGKVVVPIIATPGG